jgi:hypothetical protein
MGFSGENVLSHAGVPEGTFIARTSSSLALASTSWGQVDEHKNYYGTPETEKERMVIIAATGRRACRGTLPHRIHPIQPRPLLHQRREAERIWTNATHATLMGGQITWVPRSRMVVAFRERRYLPLPRLRHQWRSDADNRASVSDFDASWSSGVEMRQLCFTCPRNIIHCPLKRGRLFPSSGLKGNQSIW